MSPSKTKSAVRRQHCGALRSVKNITRGQQFTPILVASHKAGVRLFELGEPASSGLQTVAEEGNVAPLTQALQATPGVLEVTNSGALLDPGASVTIKVRTRGPFDHVSVAAMLIPTNDGFFAVNGARGPRGRETPVLMSVAYDSGSERNDELCASIPGHSSTNAADRAVALRRSAVRKATCTCMPASMGSAT